MEEARAVSRREQNKIITRGRILDAAKELFAAHGVAGTTIDDLARRSGVSRATFFNYFQSKDAVLAALWSDQMDDLTALIDDLLARPMPTRARVRALGRGIVHATERHPGYLRVVTAELERDLATPEISGARTERFHAQLLRLVQAGIAQREVRVDYEPAFLAQMIAAVYVSVLRYWRLDPGYDLAVESANAMRFVGDAVSPPESPA